MLCALLSRREPDTFGNGFSRLRGFTVVELMTVLAIAAVVAGVAFPSFLSLIEKRQVTSGAEQVAAFLSAVQVEAVSRNERLVVDYHRTDSDSWCVGVTTNTSAPFCDCTQTDESASDFCAIDSNPRVLRSTNLTYPDVLAAVSGTDVSDSKLGFDPVRGLTGEPTNNFLVGDVASFDFVSYGGLYALNVDVGPTGRVHICSDASNTHVPGYQQC